MTRRTLAVATTLIALSTTGPGWAAPEPVPVRRERPPTPDLADNPSRSEFARSVGLMFVHLVRTELDLSDEQVLQILPLVERIEEIRKASMERRRELADELQRLATSPSADGAAVGAAIRALDTEEEAARRSQNTQRDLILEHLNPQQKAGFVIYANRLHERLQRQLRRDRGEPDGEAPGPWRGDGRRRRGSED